MMNKDYLDTSAGNLRSFGVGLDSAISSINIERIDELIATRLSKLRLPEDLAVIFRKRSARSNTLILSSWCLWVAGFGLISLFLGATILPARQLGLGVISSVIVTLAFLLASAFIRRSTYKRKRDVIVFVPVILTIALSLMNGFLSHEPATLLIYMIMSMAVAWSALTYIQIEFILTISIAVFTMVLLLVLTMLSDLPNPWEKSLLVVFLLVSTCGMVNARRVQNIYSYRLFLLQVRDEIRSKQMETLNTQLAGIAYTDRLTDIPNRRYFDEKIAAMRANPQAFLPLALCLIDIDHFKLLNDRLGHQQGDRCLQMVAATLRENLRTKTDLLARYGGEEFVVVLPQTEFTTAMQLIERLRLAVRSLHLPNPGAPIGQVTMSAGVAVAECTSFDPDILLEEADRALYRAKTAGRDQICI